MPEFWTSCGYRLLKADSDGRLVVTEEFLKSFLLRPELAPVLESCAAECAPSTIAFSRNREPT